MQQELDRLRSQTERNAHRFVQMWTGKSVEAAFGGWVTVVAQSKLTRAKAERFAAVRTTRGVRRVLRRQGPAPQIQNLAQPLPKLEAKLLPSLSP